MEDFIKLLKDNSEWVIGSLLTIFGLWIGILQYKFNKIKFRRDSFEKNFKYYSLCEDFIYKILYGWVTIEDCTDFQKSMKEVEFLFDNNVNEFVNKILAIGFLLARLNENIKVYQRNDSILTEENIEEKKKLMKEKSELLKQAEPLRAELKTVFNKYLKIK